MKNSLLYILLACTPIFSCEENEVMPAYEKKGTTTSTVATIGVSNDEPEPGETVTIALMYVSPDFDPVETVELKYKIGSGSYSVLQTFDESTTPMNEAVTREITFVAPAVETKVTFDMVITSQKEYPQIMRTSMDVTE
jgi:hypothetical protein